METEWTNYSYSRKEIPLTKAMEPHQKELLSLSDLIETHQILMLLLMWDWAGTEPIEVKGRPQFGNESLLL